MAYNWTQLTNAVVTNFYLYGQATKPTNLASDSWIRGVGTQNPYPYPALPVVVDVDAVAYMSSGPGRFANASQVPVVAAFMSGGLVAANGQRQVFNIGYMASLLDPKFNPANPIKSFSVRNVFEQRNYSDAIDDRGYRTYVWNSTTYLLNQNVDFVIEADGRRHITGLNLRPGNDDFDFVSSSSFATAAAFAGVANVDPTRIGRTVDFEFDAASKNALPTVDYTQANFLADQVRQTQSYTPTNGLLAVQLLLEQQAVWQQLWDAGVTKLLDSSNRPILHGTESGDTMDGSRRNASGGVPQGSLESNFGFGGRLAAYNSNGIAYIAGKGNDVVTAGATNDYLDGGINDDRLSGGIGNDTYVFKAGDGKDTINDSDGRGSIKVGSTPLTGATTPATSPSTNQRVWTAGSGASQVIYTLDQGGKNLVIFGALLGAGSQITINNFDLNMASQATGSGYLGIKLNNTAKVAVIQSVGANVFSVDGFDPSSLAGQQSNITEGCGKTFTICLNQPAKANETITLALASLAAQFKVILGDSVVAADGAVITLAEGQTQVSFALVQEGDVTADASTSISATYAGAEGSVTSNAWGVNLHDAGPISKTKNGDQHPVVDNVFQTYPWITTSWAADGTLSGGVTEANFSDVLNGTAGNDKLSGLGGNDALSGGAGNDEIDGGMGDDLIGGGTGSDRILGGIGDDYITSSATLHVAQRYSLSDSWHPPGTQQVVTQGALWGIYKDTLPDGYSVTIWDGPDSPMGQDADVVDAGAGDDWVTAGGGGDRVQGGLGDDQIDGMGGNDVLEGGDGKDAVIGDGLIKAGFLNTLAAQYHGADFIDGGAGDDNLVGGGSNDVVYGGLDNDRMWGDGYGKASESDYLDPTYQGNDYLDGEDGNDYMDGGGKDDTLYGGAGDDDMWGDPSASNVDTPAANALVWGNDYLDGATYLVARSALKSSATGGFDWKGKQQKLRKRRFRGHWGHSNTQTVPAYSMRVTRPKGLGRRMDSAGSAFV
jgi:Ca2+-binding RTX toxin-like protein